MKILINDEKLKPCPFCGGYVHQDKTVSYFRDYVLYCEGCDMYFALDSFNAEASDLVEKFNKRAGNSDQSREADGASP